MMCCLFVGLTGCQGSLKSAPETPPPEKGPDLGPDSAVRPEYIINQQPKRMGTAFVVKDKAGKAYMLTAAHVLDSEADWKKIESCDLIHFGRGGVGLGGCSGKPIYVGKPFDKGKAGLDLVIWPLSADAKVTALKLAAEDAMKNEWVWVVGQEANRDLDDEQTSYLCKVTGAEGGGILLTQKDEFRIQAFSGAPIVNAKGEVIGSLLGGRDKTIIAAKVSSIRERLAEAKVELP
jgi:S1-C subfamily serine protease